MIHNKEDCLVLVELLELIGSWFDARILYIILSSVPIRIM